jgi:ectoine hydroxylase-related dioxygenase (phytanoyl-CoA dioxygenase family)
MIDDPAETVTLRVHPGDVVILDYRLLHATTANATPVQRNCVLLSFVPRWRELPSDLRAHLIRHLAQPRVDEAHPAVAYDGMLPTFEGVPADLTLNRRPPTGEVAFRL